LSFGFSSQTRIWSALLRERKTDNLLGSKLRFVALNPLLPLEDLDMLGREEFACENFRATWEQGEKP
jgi:hypothetical protein